MAESKLSWLAKYGVPSLVLSAAVFALQQQQQTFDRVQRVTADGWLYYSTARTELRFEGDAQREIALLKVIGYAFPNIFCDVRSDMLERVYFAEAPAQDEGPAPVAAAAGRPPVTPPPTAVPTSFNPSTADSRRSIRASDIDNLDLALNAYTTPKRVDVPSNLVEAWFPAKSAKPCSSDASGGLSSAKSQPEKAGAEPRSEQTSAPASGAVQPDAAPAPSPAGETRSSQPGGAASAGGAAPGLPPSPPADASASVPQPELKPATQDLVVYFHIPNTGRRDASVASSARIALTPLRYRIIRQVQRIAVASFPNQAEVRFFGEAQRADAEQLALFLDYQFRDEGLHFTPKPIGQDFPNMPPSNIEVWVTDP